MKKKSDENGGCLSIYLRYFVLAIGSACISSIASNMTVINFTLICMTGNSTGSAEQNPYSYSVSQKGQIMWAAAFGTLFAAGPFQILYQKYGARWIFFIAGVISTLSTALLPLAASTSYYSLLFCRVLQGVSFGADFAAIGLIVVNWASLKQHGLFISFLSSFSQFSVMFTMPVSGELCNSSWGWESAYYVHALISGLLFIIWILFYRNDPVKHPCMTDVELEKIHRGKGEVKAREKVPVGKIMKNKVMWAVWISSFGELMMSQFIVMYGPTFLKEVLGYSVNNTGYFVALPRAIHLLFKIVSGIASDRINCIPEKLKMKIFNTIALMISGVFFCVLGYLPTDLPSLSIGAILIIEASTGFICGGFYKCATLAARQHSHFVLSLIQFIKCLSLFIEPLLIVLICQNNTIGEWRIVFLIHGILLILGNIVFCIYATDEPADFTHDQTGEEMTNLPPERKRLTDEEEN